MAFGILNPEWPDPRKHTDTPYVIRWPWLRHPIIVEKQTFETDGSFVLWWPELEAWGCDYSDQQSEATAEADLERSARWLCLDFVRWAETGEPQERLGDLPLSWMKYLDSIVQTWPQPCDQCACANPSQEFDNYCDRCGRCMV